ncbi:MAG TPA: hypothetical protein VL689_10305 [Paraburkholderia sp.]|jgi:hypothetical protein|nr:hypothetical protein [Paraburkholderia sp.]
MSTQNPASTEASGERLALAWDALSDARDWSMFACAYEALAREYLTAGIAMWQDSVARFAQSQGELGAALSGACHECGSAWENACQAAWKAPGAFADAAQKH